MASTNPPFYCRPMIVSERINETGRLYYDEVLDHEVWLDWQEANEWAKSLDAREWYSDVFQVPVPEELPEGAIMFEASFEGSPSAYLDDRGRIELYLDEPCGRCGEYGPGTEVRPYNGRILCVACATAERFRGVTGW